MENASKALIIAGAILLSILIIALGIYVFNMAKGVTDTTLLSETEVQTYNTQFTAYKGKVIGSALDGLIEKCITNTTVNKDSNERLPDICVAGTGLTQNVTSKTGALGVTEFSTLRSQLAPKHYYYVDFAYDEDTGCIKAIAIGYLETDLQNTALPAARAVVVN